MRALLSPGYRQPALYGLVQLGEIMVVSDAVTLAEIDAGAVAKMAQVGEQIVNVLDIIGVSVSDDDPVEDQGSFGLNTGADKRHPG